MPRSIQITLLLLLTATLVGCGGKTKLTATGFLSDYSRLTPDPNNAQRLEYVSPTMWTYTALIVDPITVREINEPPKLTTKERAEIIEYMHAELVEVFESKGYELTSTPGTHAARVRIAITDIKKSDWWLNLHPASKLSGVGTGGASMEAEVVDSMSGVQVLAVVQSATGSQFELDTFSGIDDVKDAIDTWIKACGNRIDAARARNQ